MTTEESNEIIKIVSQAQGAIEEYNDIDSSESDAWELADNAISRIDAALIRLADFVLAEPKVATRAAE